tara:strand:- start:74 stop:652 length:579 start_codon:yes stop_codon:yes gene_type:complete
MNYVAKEDVINYPLINFNGNVHVIDSLKDVSSCLKVLSKADIIGFDTETKPSFAKGVFYPTSLIQLSYKNDIFLFRLNKIGLVQGVIDILINPSILKVGIDIKNDLSDLKKIHLFNEANFVDLNQLAIQKGFKSIGAVKLSIMLLGCRISKKQRLSDWSVDFLTDAQIEYAAIDAWICPKILQAFMDKSLYP